MSESAKYMSLPFADAIAFFLGKLDIPTERWTDLWQGMHARAFTVAGAMKADLLADLRGAVDKAISSGTTLAEFRKDFDRIVASHGWDYKGGRAWRSRVIYQTNVSTAYHAGHYKQMTTPAMLTVRPYWRYLSSSSAEKRPEHMAWYNLVLPHDDPFWQTHYPPNGWGCKCGVASLSNRDLQKLESEKAGTDYPVQRTAPPLETYEWTDKATGRTEQVPQGIDPGWAYNVGEAAWGRQQSARAMEAWRVQGPAAWERLTPGGWQSAGRPAAVPAVATRTKPGPALKDAEAIAAAAKKMLGAQEKVFSAGTGAMRIDTLVNAEVLSESVPPAMSAYLPLLPELMEAPGEVWAAFERHRGTGKMALRQRLVKCVTMDGKAVLLAARASGGFLESVSMAAASDLSAANADRVGKLVLPGK